MDTPEHQMYEVIKHWKPEQRLLDIKDLMSLDDPYFKLFEKLYALTKKQCAKGPMRKNGEPCFIHPLNVVLNLKRAGVKDGLTLCIGLLHDIVEDRVDEYQSSHKIKLEPEGVKCLRCYEKKMYYELHHEIKEHCSEKDREILIKAVMALTRTKRTFYYKSIADLFLIKDLDTKKRAIQIKLADRLHNILCIESFGKEQRIYECFKNMFILNNAKKFIVENYGKDILLTVPSKSITAKLFKKCCKATYDAFLRICSISLNKKTSEVKSMLHLAFRKFVFEKGGLWDITKFDAKEKHLMRLFQGVIRKYDARLMLNYEMFNEREINEREYCKKFFADYKFNDEEIQSIVYYKDAYALKEIIAKLLYDIDYVLPGFRVEDLSKKGKIRK
ncbi:MAG: HD domain-containing protein [Candidatus Woesearchaeota archaeon]